MNISKKGPIVNPGKCRCCGMIKRCRLINFEYESFGNREVYSEMFVDCFGLVYWVDYKGKLKRKCASIRASHLRTGGGPPSTVPELTEIELKFLSILGEDLGSGLPGIQVSVETELTHLSHLDAEEAERLICATCVMRLRDAVAFRHQVLQCEEQLLSANVHIHDEEEEDKVKVEVEVKQEAVTVGVEISADNNGTDELMNDGSDGYDDHHIDTELSAENIETESTTIKDESSQVINKVKKGKKTRRLRRSTADGASTMKLNTSMQADMLNKLQRMKEKLNKKKCKELKTSSKAIQPDNHKPKVQRPPILDKEFNTLRNTLTIIENSYVTPFIAMFSDYHCVYCREMFIKPEKLREHTLEHDPRTYQEFINPRKMSLVDIERIDCRLCQAQIDSIDSFKEHITTVHNKTIYKDVDCEFIKFKLKVGKLNCVECEKPFNFFQALKKHMAEHFGTYICDECGAHYFEERHLVFHKKTHISNRSVEMFPCSECEKTFRSKNSRNFHIARIHKNEAAYPCNKCDEVFISYHMRYRHKMNVHGEKREFPCENCDKVYDSRKTLRDHYQRTHLQLLRHECTHCDKKFYLPSALRDHMTSHTGERLYRCDYCGKNYPRKKALKVHLQSHNTEKKYKCSFCPSSYTQANNFKNHMRSKHPMQPEYSEGYT